MLDILLPQRCVVCHAGGAQLCEACRAALPRITEPVCARCGAPTAWPVRRCGECSGRRLAFASARAAVRYDEAVRSLVTAWKERGLRRLATTAAEVVAEALERPGVEVAAHVPADRDRRLRRGHHAAEALARELARAWELPVAPLLVRTRRLRPQRGLPVAERRRNVAGAFVAPARVPRRVLLIDDVYTTGSTVNAAASSLRRGGAREVVVVTFARAVRVG